MTIWAPGMRCVCIDGDWPSGAFELPFAPPSKGKVYVVERIDLSQGRPFLAFDEFPPTGDGGRHFWVATKFRPLSEARLDQFRAHLAPAPRDVVPA